MENITAETVWAVVAGILAAVVLIGNAIDKVAKLVQAFRAPNAAQDARLKELEDWRKKVDQALARDLHRFDALDEGERVTQRALLALLDHGIDGNNIEQMQRAKDALQNHLIDR